MYLNSQELIEAAERKTSLADWDGEEFRRPFGILVDAINEEAGLHPLGRARAHQWLQLRLEQRLRMVEDRKRRSEICEQQIDRPTFLIGFPRAGTTYLHTLLSLDPATIAPLFWQLSLPSPPPNDPACDQSGSIHRIQDMLEYQGWLTPEIARTHHHAADLPEEDFFGFEYSFVSTGFMGFFDIPSYVAQVVAGDFSVAYAWHRRVLQALQVGTKGRRWMLKAPEHTMHVETLLAAYPDALLVQHHRDPSKVMASVFSVLSACRGNYTDRVQRLSKEQARDFMLMYANGIEHAMELRNIPAVECRFLDIHYRDLERDPVACVRRVYDHAGLTFAAEADAAVGRWVVDNRKGKHGKHRYLLAEYGLTQNEVRAAFARYIDRFRVEFEGEA
ncbi:MAG: sulfotransferase [Rhodospirillaceae bacterium]|nr:MAG: sulfotransferase [Rhodospirillaceae bacterium]